MDVKELQYITDRFDKLENKLDAHLTQSARLETDVKWLKSASKWLAATTMAIIGKLAHLAFFG